MAVLPLRMIGDPVLRTAAASVSSFDESLRRLVTDMYETMDHAGGIGLAAPQIGVGLRIFTYDVGGERGAVVNPALELSGPPSLTPRLVHDGPAEGENLVQEGCLSVAGVHSPVRRPQQAALHGAAPDGSPVELWAEGLLAVCFQHEIDHLEGRLFIDRLDGEEKRAALRTLREVAGTEQSVRKHTGSSFFGG